MYGRMVPTHNTDIPSTRLRWSRCIAYIYIYIYIVRGAADTDGVYNTQQYAVTLIRRFDEHFNLDHKRRVNLRLSVGGLHVGGLWLHLAPPRRISNAYGQPLITITFYWHTFIWQVYRSWRWPTHRHLHIHASQSRCFCKL